jgi:hypothetical protein
MLLDVCLCSFQSHPTIMLTGPVAQERGKSIGGATEAFAGLRIDSSSSKPPRQPARPAPPSDDEDSVEEEDENDPFGDRNAVQTPHIEKGAPKW